MATQEVDWETPTRATAHGRRAHSRWSRSLWNSQSSPWFWWVEGGVVRGPAGEREGAQVWGLRGQELLYTCRVRCDLGTCLLVYFPQRNLFSFILKQLYYSLYLVHTVHVYFLQFWEVWGPCSLRVTSEVLGSVSCTLSLPGVEGV